MIGSGINASLGLGSSSVEWGYTWSQALERHSSIVSSTFDNANNPGGSSHLLVAGVST